jgi:AcrR family transcriptional regulator
MTDQKRPYRMKKRAEAEEATRRRITESAVHLHGTVGPAHTTVSALAEHAGVRRSTVYRHFPDEATLFAACTVHWRAENPIPDIGAWAGLEDPGERLRAALAALYPYYRRTARMMENLIRDEPVSELVRQHFSAYHGYVEASREMLMRGRGARGRARTRERAAIGHALAFTTWRSLALDEGLDDEQAAELMTRLVECER